MCTLTLILRQSHRHPLIVAANRDESFARPADPPHLWAERAPRMVAGRDQQAGGTWNGLNEHGLFAGLTNLWDGSEADPQKRSRGEAVVELLEASTLEEAREKVGAWDIDTFNPFLLVAADLFGNAFWCSSGDALRIHEIEAGVHSFGNHLPGHPDNEKLVRARNDVVRVWEDEGAPMEGLGMLQHPADLASGLGRALAGHHGSRGPEESLCVHTEKGFGTVSSTIMILGEERPREGLIWYADGPPCTTNFEDHTNLLSELFV